MRSTRSQPGWACCCWYTLYTQQQSYQSQTELLGPCMPNSHLPPHMP
eukprot:XP_001703826.1 Hypothetical protein GL50803_128210 [Giardia lamblia ATCC 50803]